MTDLLPIFLILILNSLYIFGFHNAGSYEIQPKFKHLEVDDPNFVPSISQIEPHSEMVLTRFRLCVERAIGFFWAKPVITCPMCMASLHSWVYPIAILFGIIPGGTITWILYPVYICALSAMNAAVSKYFTLH